MTKQMCQMTADKLYILPARFIKAACAACSRASFRVEPVPFPTFSPAKKAYKNDKANVSDESK